MKTTILNSYFKAGFELSIVLFFIIGVATPANILSIAFYSSKSHKLTYLPLLEELGKRGHNVTVVSPISATKVVPNVTEILALEWTEIDRLMSKDWNPFEPEKSLKSANPFLMLDFFTELCTKSLELPQVKKLLKGQFDLIFLQPTFNECALGILYKLKAPIILWSPLGVGGFVIEKVGSHFPPSFIPHVYGEGFEGEPIFFQRFKNFLLNLSFEILLKFYYEPHMTSLYRTVLKDDSIPSVTEILRDQTAMILSNGHFSLHRSKPYLPDVVDVGGIHSRPAKPLPKDLEDFIQKGKKHGFIYFSMGSALTGSKMPDAKRKTFLNVFSKLKQQVLWKWETETMPDLPANVKLSKWLPQQDLLGHPQIKMFITHCDGGSTEEAVYHGTPLIGIPMFGDQKSNAKLAKSHGFMVELNWVKMTEEKLMSAIQEILNQPDYSNNVRKLSSIFKDQPDDPLNRAVYWAEYVIRHNGAFHLRSVGRNLNFMQYHSYDVIATCIAILCLLLYVVLKSIKLFVCRLCCKKSYHYEIPIRKSKKE